MFHLSWPRAAWPALLSLLLALPAGAGDARDKPAAARPHPTHADAPVPKATHRSALAGYRRHAEAEPQGWRDANDTVGRIGGWRAYAREAAAAASAPAPAAQGVRP